jgi:hypothetical protein
LFGCFAQQSAPGMMQVVVQRLQFARQLLPMQGTLPQQAFAFGGG